jgi:purine-binding chemotaxis protein CheW
MQRVSPDTALQHYFDELLSETEPQTAAALAEPQVTQLEPAVEAERQQELQRLLQTFTLPAVPAVAVAEVIATPGLAKVEAKVVTPVVAPPVARHAEPVAPPVIEPAPEQQPELAAAPASNGNELPAWSVNGRPSWAQQRFDVLLFQVSGLTLAVPLMSLGQIQPLTDELTPLFGQADWFMGLQPTPSGKIRTVNTAKFVMPERYDENFLKTARYVVSINGVPWGLAVDSVNQPITLMPEDVKWRSERGKRPWLAGTVKEHMCALLDTETMGHMLVAADKNAKHLT